jgi:hypothetical protein
MEAASTSETSVNFYQTTRRNSPDDSHLHTRRRENLKSHHIFYSFLILILVETVGIEALDHVGGPQYNISRMVGNLLFTYVNFGMVTREIKRTREPVLVFDPPTHVVT